MIEKLTAPIKKWFKRTWPVLLAYVLIFVFFIKKFTGGLMLVFMFIEGIFKYQISLLGQANRAAFIKDLNPYLTEENITSLFTLIFCVIMFVVLYRFSLFMTAQFTLPVHTLADRKKAYQYLVKYSKGEHGPAVFVKEGQRIEKPGERDSARPGVILADLSSAVALGKKEKVKTNLFKKKTKKVEADLTEDIVADEKLDAKGPGVIFTEAGQRIVAVLDLRKQSRGSDEIEAYTRDGIRVKTKVNVTFSISDEPDTINVGSVRDEMGAVNIMGLVFSSEDQDGRVVLKEAFDLEEEDILFIKNGAANAQDPDPAVASTAPYRVYPDRILKAALSSAKKTGGEIKSWYDAPIDLATDIFRKLLSNVQYDDLFSGANMESPITYAKPDGKKDGKQLFVSVLKGTFSRIVKMKGLLKYKRYHRLDREPFVVGQPISNSAIKKDEPVWFLEPKYNSVRKYGVVILSASFGEIRPVDKSIQEKMTENWRAKIQNEIDLIRAEYELEAIRVKNRNRAQIQHETTYLLSSIFESSPHFEEALALRVLNALETAVTDPSRQDITSAELYTMLENLYKWLLEKEEDEEGDDKSKGNTHTHSGSER